MKTQLGGCALISETKEEADLLRKVYACIPNERKYKGNYEGWDLEEKSDVEVHLDCTFS